MTTAVPFVYTYQLGGITFQIQSDLRLSDFLADKFQRFTPVHTQPDVICRIRGIVPRASRPVTNDPSLTESLIHWLPREILLQPWPLLHSPQVEAALRAGLAHPHSVRVELRTASITITDVAQRRMDIFYHRDNPYFTHDTRYLGTEMISPFLPAFDATLLHSAGAVWGGVAGLFLAPDGGGKTTLASLIRPGGVVMSDDQNVVRSLGGQFRAYSLPWCRILGSTGHHPVGGLFFLEKAPDFDLIPLKATDALGRIALDPQNALGPLPKAYRLRVALLRVALLQQVPAYRLRFSRAHVDWDAIGAAMRAPMFAQAARSRRQPPRP